jgi:monoterpene epsilon-lactone hydrolase
MTIRFIRSQLRKIQSRIGAEPIEIERMGQEFVGTLLQKTQRVKLRCEPVELPSCKAAEIFPLLPDRTGAALYLHGGGYCCGDLAYAKGFGSMLAAQANVRVLCPAYRLAPEFRYPAALDDAMDAYRYLLTKVPAEKLLLAGESAGGGLLYSVCLRARAEGLPLPGGLVAMSPWLDETQSAPSYAENELVDPSLTRARLMKFAECFSSEPENPLVSPLFADLRGLPESMIFVGGDEILRDDATVMHQKLLQAGCASMLTVALGLWHGYILYNLKERRQDMERIAAFTREVTK